MTVSVPTLWLIAAVVLGLSELLVGTFYLLLLGVAALVGAIVALAGFAPEIQCLIAAAVVLVGGVILARYRAHHKKDAKGLANDNLDIGQTRPVFPIAEHSGRRAPSIRAKEHRVSSRLSALPVLYWF